MQAAKQAKDETAELNQQIADLGDNQGAIAQELQDLNRWSRRLTQASEGQKALEELRKQASSTQKETESFILHMRSGTAVSFIREIMQYRRRTGQI